MRSSQRTAIKRYPYFVNSQIVLTTRWNAKEASGLTRRVVSRLGSATETTGFNCTPGHSAFQSPCTTRKAGLAVIERTPRRPLFVNVVSRVFPKLAQMRGGYPPARVLKGGSLAVKRMRVEDR